MARELHTAGFSGGIAELSPARIVEYWLTCDFHRERRTRVILGAFAASGGGVDPGIHRHLQGRRINKIVKSEPYRPYSDGEWRRLTEACTQMITASHRGHQQALQAAERGTNPACTSPEHLAWVLRRCGPAPMAELDIDIAAGTSRTELLKIRRELYPDANTALAYLTLFAMRTGIVPDGIDQITLADITRTSETSVLLSYVKGRTGREVLNLPRDAVRLLNRWLGHSAALREHAGDLAAQLWIYVPADGRGPTRRSIFTRPRNQYHRRAWITASGVLGDDGRPLPLHGGRIRATYHHRRDRSSWTGRTTIDPNHSAGVEGDHYLSSHTPAQLDAIESIIEQAQTDLRRKAEPPVTLTGEDAAEFASNFPRLVEQAGLDAAAIQALLTGEQDVFVAACAAPLNSPHAPAGTLCPARPWVCLLCPLAVFAARHLPNLLGLKEFFAGQAMQMTTVQFLRVFGPYVNRLDEDILPRFGTAAITAAARRTPAAAAELPLHLEELPQ
jgi:hypothetical protein